MGDSMKLFELFDNEPNNTGAGCILISKDTGKMLLVRRSQDSSEPGTWACVGGSTDYGENPKETAIREVFEEIGYTITDTMKLVYIYEDKHKDFKYYNFISVIPNEFIPKLNSENDSYVWCDIYSLPKPEHFGIKCLFENPRIVARIFDSLHIIDSDVPSLMCNKVNESENKTIDIERGVGYTINERGDIKIIGDESFYDILYTDLKEHLTDYYRLDITKPINVINWGFDRGWIKISYDTDSIVVEGRKEFIKNNWKLISEHIDELRFISFSLKDECSNDSHPFFNLPNNYIELNRFIENL